MTAKGKKALIIFSRLPIGRETKTRLTPVLNENQREELHVFMWRKIFSEVMKLIDCLDVFLFWTGTGNIKDYMNFIPPQFHLAEQNGANLGARMSNAVKKVLGSGYESALVIGSDIPELKAENLTRAFDTLKSCDVVLGPSEDGGYWLIGMKEFIPEAFNLSSWGNAGVLERTIEQLRTLGFTHEFADTLQDIDTPEDLKRICPEFLGS